MSSGTEESARPSRSRIGIFGGTFDPVHNAHLALAEQALKDLQLDQLLWIPAGQPWQKQGQRTPAVHREAMVRLAIEGHARFALSNIETSRSGPSYTLDTVHLLQAEHANAQWFLLLGQDQLAGFHSWRGWQELLSLVTLAVANRPGAPLQADPRVASQPHRVIAMPMLSISSTLIRQRLADGESVADLVPAAVASYIARHHLYASQSLPRS